MISREIVNGYQYRSLSERVEQIKLWRNRYRLLVANLGRMGSEVLSQQTIYNEILPSPKKFIENAHHEFVFPKQAVTLIPEPPVDPVLDDEGRTILFRRQTYQFDPSAVRGHVRVEYSDYLRVVLRIGDVIGSSVLDPEVTSLLVANGLDEAAAS